VLPASVVKDKVIELPIAMLQPGNNVEDASIVGAACECKSSTLNLHGKVDITSRPTAKEEVEKLMML
jgi:bifunctional N-acetylglucosamine-1-phosphate-uridyltransferase/glucosamine-1-phosphate-acetyltransferase GlmU-like protein